MVRRDDITTLCIKEKGVGNGAAPGAAINGSQAGEGDVKPGAGDAAAVQLMQVSGSSMHKP